MYLVSRKFFLQKFKIIRWSNNFLHTFKLKTDVKKSLLRKNRKIICLKFIKNVLKSRILRFLRNIMKKNRLEVGIEFQNKIVIDVSKDIGVPGYT